MDLIAVVIIGIIVTATGGLNPGSKDPQDIAQAPQQQSYNSCPRTS